METILENVRAITWQMLLMWCIGGGLIYLAIRKNMEPALLLPMGFGAILVNLPFSGAITQGLEAGPLDVLFQAGIANELFPLLLFIGIGAMIDFGPLLADPKLLIFGAAAQAGIFLTLILASPLTGRHPSSWPTTIPPNIWGPSSWRPTPTWPWSPSSSPR